MTFKPVPWVTIALVVINCFVLFFVQSGDSKGYAAAVRYYDASVLPGLEVPAFAKFLDQEGRNDEAKELRSASPKKVAQGGFPIMLQREYKFIQQLHHDEWIKPDNAGYGQWKTARAEFEALLSKVVSEEYSFKPDAPEAMDMFTHMFLHGGFDHLLGNMIFLVLLGFVVERLIGSMFYLLIYIVGGLCAVATFALVSAGSGVSLVGASGAIGALMGIYVVLFGWRKIPFFYSLGFYFDYVRAPALLLLVAFLAKELYFHFTSDNHVAYMAHFGGILSGALFGIMLNRIRTIPVDDMLAELEKSEQAHIKPWQAEFDQAMAMVEKLRFEKAGAIFARLHEQYPDEHGLLQEWYKVERNMPAGESFHAAARAIMLGKPNSPASASEVHDVYNEYIRLAQPGPRIDRALLLSLARTFAERGFLDDAEKLVRLLVRKSADASDLASLVLVLARRLRQGNQAERAVPYLKWVAGRADQPALAKQAQALLKV
ncbi:MAG TPA: rhomboid family intramembrane serine protease [Mariprofundaceae bacterium]|nr:rhomboid family intramembrane serine protease [Mariprofundaceae bacterium]